MRRRRCAPLAFVPRAFPSPDASRPRTDLPERRIVTAPRVSASLTLPLRPLPADADRTRIVGSRRRTRDRVFGAPRSVHRAQPPDRPPRATPESRVAPSVPKSVRAAPPRDAPPRRRRPRARRRPVPPRSPRASRRRLDMTATAAAAAAAAYRHRPRLRFVPRARARADAADTAGSRHGSRPESVDGGDDVSNPIDNPDEMQSEFRERLWGYLLGNMVRAVDEVYFLCELECGAVEIEGAASLLEESARDFRQLATRLKSQEEYAASPGRRGASRGTWGGRTCARAQTPKNSYARCLSPRRDPRRDRVAGRRRARVRISTATTEAREWRTAGRGGKSTKPGGVTAATAPAPAGRSTEAGGTPAVRAAVRGTGGPGTSSSARRIEPRRRGRSRFVEVSQIHRPTSRRRPRRRTPSPPTDRATAK